MLRDHAIVLTAAALTSVVMVVAGRRWGWRGLAAAVLAAVELIGATTLFFLANLAVGVVLVLAVRGLTPFYPSLYEVTEIALLLVSLVQAAIVETWRRPARRGDATRLR
jgi:hypothetical protein